MVLYHKSTKFKVQIKREEKIVVDLSFPLFVLNSLENFVPEKAFDYLNQNKIDLKAVLIKIEESAYTPQTILEFTHEERQFHLWIE